MVLLASHWICAEVRNTFLHLTPVVIMDLKQDRQNEEKTLAQLEPDDWGACSSESEINQRLFRLRDKPLKLLDPGDLRVAIHFGVGMDYVMPLALDLLWHDPWLDSGNYAGDLLGAVLRGNAEFYAKRPDCYRNAMDVAAAARRAYEAMAVEDQQLSGIDEASIKRLGKAMAELKTVRIATSPAR